MFYVPRLDVQVPMFEMPSGHMSIDIMHFPSDGFEMEHGVSPVASHQFRLQEPNRAMLAQRVQPGDSVLAAKSRFEPPALALSDFDGNVGLHGACEPDRCWSDRNPKFE